MKIQKSKPSFSVLVANYNNGPYLKQLVESVKKQSIKDWELIIVDDHSTDDSKKYLETLPRDKRIRILYHEKNMGAAAAFYSAAFAATSEICGLLGADDALVPNALEKVLALHLSKPAASLIYSDYYACDNELKIIGKSGWVAAIPEGESAIVYRTVSNFVTFKKKFYDLTSGFDATFRRAVDQDLYFKLEEVGELLFLNEPLYLYRQNPNGISQMNNSFKAHLWELIAVLKGVNRRIGTRTIKNLRFREILYTIVRFIWIYSSNFRKLGIERKGMAIQFSGVLFRIISKTIGR